MVYFMASWYVLWSVGMFCVVNWYIFPRFGMLWQEKSGSRDPAYAE
jgi:hypothetical protein